MLSIIIPTVDEAKVLAKTLTRVQNLDGDFEVIVVDGHSQDGTRKIAEHLGVKVLKSERGIPQQLGAGIAKAKGDIFLFLHADTLLEKGAITNITTAIEEHNFEAGAFTLQYEKFHFLSSLQAFITNVNAKLFGRCSGEQALFVTKDALMRSGGIPQVHAFETEKLCAQLKKNNIKIHILKEKVFVNNRRFLNGGIKEFLKVNLGHTLSSIGFSDWNTKRFVSRVR